jgi:serine protease Do
MEFKPALTEMNPQVAATERSEPEGRTSMVAKAWGLTVANLGEAERQAVRGVSGVRITAVAAGAEAVGLRAGDVIVAVGQPDVADLKQFEAMIAKFDKTRPLPLTVRRGDWAQFILVPVLR